MKTLGYLAWFAGACALALAQQNKTSPNTSSLSATDIAAIRGSNDSYRRTALEQAWAQWANHFTADAVLMPPNVAAVTGRANIEAWGRALPRITQFQNPIAEIEGASDSAVMRGTFAITFAPLNQPGQKDAGKWICTLRKQDGAWKFHRCIFNSDHPVPATAASVSPGADPVRAPRSAVQIEHDRKAILAMSDEHMLAVNLLNPERLLATYTDDIVNLIPDQPPLIGLAASRVFVPARHAEIGSIKVVRHLDQIEIHGDLAVERGTISGNLTMKGKSGSQRIDLKYVWVWRRQPDGSWKTAYNISNQNATR